MARRVVLLVAVLAATMLFTAAPAGAVTPFGSIATVAPAPPGCTIDTANGDAAISTSGGVIRGFFNFVGPGCDADDIWFAGGFGTTWTVQLTPYSGQVLASDQGFDGALVLYASSSGIFLGERFIGNGSYAPTRQLSSTAPGAVSPQGDVLAGTNDTYWAVWTEQVGPGGEFAQTELFQAKTYGNDLSRTQVTNNPDNDSQPALAFKPGGGGELAFIRDDGFGNEPTHSNLRLATASGTTGSWVGRQFAVIGVNTNPSIDTTPGTGGHTYLAWLRDGQVFESDDRSGSFLSRAFVSDALSTSIDVSGGETHVAWGQVDDGTVLAERLGSGGWTKATVYPAASRLDPIVLSVGGKATVLMASATRIYKRTQIS
ncbi:MAG TPA: hypothetical protein VGS14_00125 [Actinomycetes bacterium]|jgi:hypothetical protein|nr:hypothetical protein [Actinomycetes bacterium]